MAQDPEMRLVRFAVDGIAFFFLLGLALLLAVNRWFIWFAPMRLIVARCAVRYSGRLDAVLPGALRFLTIKSDGSVMVHADTGGSEPQNWTA